MLDMMCGPMSRPSVNEQDEVRGKEALVRGLLGFLSALMDDIHTMITMQILLHS